MQAFLKTGKLGKDAPSSSSAEPGTSQPVVPKLTPWVEKYRPRTVEEVVEQSEIISVLKQVLSGGDLPHFLFYGPPGTGKTTTILAAARQLFGDIYRDRILELNASDDRGIQVIRDKVKTFSQLTAAANKPDGTPCPPYKIVILDEADSMTHAAQSALRRIMEKETRTTRFCLICNYISCIIPPIASRCAKFRFKPIKSEKIEERLEEIAKNENVSCGKDTIKVLVETCGGDLRRAITCLQSCSRLKGSESVVMEDVLEVTGIVPPQWVEKFITVCKNCDHKELEIFVDDLIQEAYSAFQVLEQLHEKIIESDFTDDQKAIICEKIAIASGRLQDGASEYLQLMDLGCCMINVLSKK
ncbi:replication factor C subunit 4 [Bemisia tabaci]|nr:PREDICTED: replication factor C subunit 4 [Bemisia tabaci]